MNTAELYAEIKIMEEVIFYIDQEITIIENDRPQRIYRNSRGALFNDNYDNEFEIWDRDNSEKLQRLTDNKNKIRGIIDRIKSDLTNSIINKYSHPNDIFDVSQEPTT